MTLDIRDDATHHELVTRRRDLVVQRLTRALDALDRKRRMVTEVVGDVASLLPGGSSPKEPARPAAGAIELPEGPARSALAGAVAGGVVVAVGLLVAHRRRERERPLRVLERAWFKYTTPPRPSLLRRLVGDALASLAMSLAQEAARAGVSRLLEARMHDDGPEVLDRPSDSPDPRFVTEPVTIDPGALHPREDTLPPAGIAPPEPIAPMPSALREFT